MCMRGRSLRVPPGNEGTVAWLKTLPTPLRVVYEAGPTGYGLARACAGAGINCVVAAPSRIRPAVDRVKTDRRDAERLAKLLLRHGMVYDATAWTRAHDAWLRVCPILCVGRA